jgi:hypothetical protein
MKFENLTMSPSNLITQEDTMFTPELKERANIGSIRVDMELHPFEMLKLVQRIGCTNIALTGSKKLTSEELNTSVLDGRITKLAPINKIDYTPIGATAYSCTAMFTGSNILSLTGSTPSEIFTEDENGNIVMNGNFMVINHLMNDLYFDIYTMINDEKGKVKDNPLYKTRFQSSNGLPSLRYLSNSVVTLDMDEADTKKLREDMTTFKKVNAGESQYNVVFYTAVFICNVTLKEYIEMEISRPHCITITAHDAIDIYSKYPLSGNESENPDEAKDMILTRLYMLPEDYKMDVAVRVMVTSSTLNILGTPGMAKTYNDIYSQLITLIEKAGLITL